MGSELWAKIGLIYFVHICPNQSFTVKGGFIELNLEEMLSWIQDNVLHTVLLNIA
jgi:hypothetical protein